MTEALSKVVFFSRVGRPIKQHQCSLCWKEINVGFPYFVAVESDGKNKKWINYCEDCFDRTIRQTLSPNDKKGLDIGLTIRVR